MLSQSFQRMTRANPELHTAALKLSAVIPDDGNWDMFVQSIPDTATEPEVERLIGLWYETLIGTLEVM
jgi:hypothetical protein